MGGAFLLAFNFAPDEHQKELEWLEGSMLKFTNFINRG